MAMEENDKITPEQFEIMMGVIKESKYDGEVNHIEADKVLCATLKSLGYEKGINIYLSLKRWFS
jgi:hypothetical protein